MNLLRGWRPAFDVFAEAVVCMYSSDGTCQERVSQSENVSEKKKHPLVTYFPSCSSMHVEIESELWCGRGPRTGFIRKGNSELVFVLCVFDCGRVYVECVRIGSLMTGAAMGKLMNRNSPFAFVNSVRHVVDE